MGSIQCVKQRNLDNAEVCEDFNTHHRENFHGEGDSDPFADNQSIHDRYCCGLLKVRHRQRYSPVNQLSNANQWPKVAVAEEEEIPGIVHAHRKLPPDRSHRTRVCRPNSNSSNVEEIRNADVCDREQLREMLHKEKGKHDVPVVLEKLELETHVHGLTQPRDVTQNSLKSQNSLHFYTTVPAQVFDRLLTLQHARRIGATKCHDRRMRIVETVSGCSFSLTPIRTNDKDLPITVPQNHGVLRTKIVGQNKDNVLRALCELNSRMPELMRNAVAPKDASPIFSYVINHGCLSLTEQVAIQFPEILSRSATWLKPRRNRDQYSHRLLIEDCRRRIERR